jgi:hypothetical protein
MQMKMDDCEAFIVNFGLRLQPDGQPDFMEAFQYLNQKLPAKNAWEPVFGTPQFEVMKISSQTFFTMAIWVRTTALDILKWHDIQDDDIRVLDEKPASSEENQRFSSRTPRATSA